MRSTFAALATACLAAGIASAPRAAHADDDRDQLLVELNLFRVAVDQAIEDGADAASSFERPATDCADVVRRLGRAGMKPDDVIDGPAPYRFRDAPERCRQYGRWREVMAAVTVITEAAGDLAIARGLEPGEVDVSTATTYGARAAACSAAIDRALAGDVQPTLTLRVRSNLGDARLTFAEVRATICGELASWAKAYGPATIAARQAAAEAARRRYAQVGAAGDKLAWLVHYDPDGTGATWFLPGCKEEGDPRKLARAPVLLRWTEATDGTHHLRRLQFKGAKLVKDTSRLFLTEGAARRGCK
jgi:hypothetical protein